MPASSTGPLADRVAAGDPRAIARAISIVEGRAPEAAALVRDLHPRTGRAFLVGITGPPGAGKSTLVDRLIDHIRKAGKTVGVIAVDPTSPFTGGAILGDRVRMLTHTEDAGVFIRSMATRGHLGGLAEATSDAALVLDAAGKDVVLIETVGVGQDEVEIVRTADVSVVTLVPGTGDEIQAIKAGVMEIADIFVINKADREGAERAVEAVSANLSLQHFADGEWQPPILKTEATNGKGIGELWEALERFREHSPDAARRRRRTRQEWRLRELVARRITQQMERMLAPGEFDRIVDAIAARDTDPYSAAERLVDRMGQSS